MSDTATKRPDNLTIRPMEEADVAAAQAIYHLAFGTFVGLAEPKRYADGRERIGFRRRLAPDGAFVAELAGEIVGSNFACRWGGFGFVGPLTVHPDFWQRGIARALMDPVLAAFERWGTAHAGLFTYPASATHLELYRRYGFWPRRQCALLTREVRRADADPDLARAGDRGFLADAAELAGAYLPGLDLTSEIEGLFALGLGETVTIGGASGLDGFAVCHCGRGSEAGPGCAYVKFGAVRPGDGAAGRFELLLAACEALAAAQGMGTVEAGVSLANQDAYVRMRARGYDIAALGMHMVRPADTGYHGPDAYILDDWR